MQPDNSNMDKKLKQLENQSLPDLSKMDEHWEDLKSSLLPGASLPKSKPGKRIFRLIVAASLTSIAFFITYKFLFKKNDETIVNHTPESKPGGNPKNDTLPSIKFIPGKETSTVIGKDTITIKADEEKTASQEFIIKAKTTDGKDVELKWTAVSRSGKKTFDTISFIPQKEKPISKPILLKGKTTGGKEIEIPAIPVNDTTTKKPAVDNKKAIQDFFAQLKKEEQSFVINNKRDTIIYGKDGTALLIPAYAFDSYEPVTITMKEYYSYKDIITNRLTTSSDDQILITGGMLYLTATVRGKEVNIHPEKSIRWFVPDTSSQLKEMELFTGQVSGSSSDLSQNSPHDTAMFAQNSSINWKPESRRFRNNYFITKVKVLDLRDDPYKTNYRKKLKAYFYINKGAELNKTELKDELQKKYPYYDKIIIGRKVKKKEGFREYTEFFSGAQGYYYFTSIGDSAWVYPYEAKWYKLKATDTMVVSNTSSASTTIPTTQLLSVASKYGIEIKRMGWVNCDRFLKMNQPRIEYVVNLNDEASDYYTVLVFQRFKSIMPGLVAGNKVIFSNVPEGEEVKVISLGAKDGKPVAAMQAVQISRTTLTGLKFEETTPSDFKEKAGGLDKP